MPGVNSTGDGHFSGPPVLANEPAASQISREVKVSPSSASDSRLRHRRRRGTRVLALPLTPDPVVLKDLNEVEPDELIDEQQGDEELAPCFCKSG